ncbi:MAG: DNA-3-methyladenine glycosylase 2 [Solirubrobacterales bacterium]
MTQRARLRDRALVSSAPPVTTQHTQGYRLETEPLAPFRLDLTAWALRRRPHNEIDRWDGSTYRRMVSIDDNEAVELSVTQEGALEAPRLSILTAGKPIDETANRILLHALDRLLGLNVDLSAFAAMAAPDPLLGPLAARMRGLRPPRFPTVFEALVNGIACQQLSLDVGIHLLNRLTAERGRAVPEDIDGVRGFPGPEELASAEPKEVKRLGFSLAKASTIVEAAQAIAAGDLDLEGLEQLEDAAAIERLTNLRGVGRWTAEYVLLRGLGRLHVFPGDDVGAHNKLRRLFDIDTNLDYDVVKRLVGRWFPYGGVVYFHLLLDSLSASGLVDEPNSSEANR